MAKKSSYKIPSSLNAGYGELEIAMQAQSGVGIKPIPVKTILVCLASGFLLFFVVSKTFISAGSALQILGFCVLWILTTWLFVSTDKTKRMQIELVMTLLNYIPKKARRIVTKKESNVSDFYGLVGISGIDDESGLVEYTDGTFGYWYRIVGSASVLLFDSDRDRIIDRVDNFYRKLDTESELIFITTKEPQHVYKQSLYLKKRYDELKVKDPDLVKLIQEQHSVIKKFVGGTFMLNVHIRNYFSS